MTFTELITKFQGRGFDYLGNEKAGDYLNDSYLIDICDAEDWPFLEEIKEGSSPLELSDLGHIEEVLNPTQGTKLEPLIRARVTESDTDLATAGTPYCYYVTGGNTVVTYPVSSETLVVRYHRTPAKLTGTESPILPERFHSLIIDAAVARAYEDSDDFELAENAETKFQRRLEKMREALLYPQHDGADDYILVTDPEAY